MNQEFKPFLQLGFPLLIRYELSVCTKNFTTRIFTTKIRIVILQNFTIRIFKTLKVRVIKLCKRITDVFSSENTSCKKSLNSSPTWATVTTAIRISP